MATTSKLMARIDARMKREAEEAAKKTPPPKATGKLAIMQRAAKVSNRTPVEAPQASFNFDAVNAEIQGMIEARVNEQLAAMQIAHDAKVAELQRRIFELEHAAQAPQAPQESHTGITTWPSIIAVHRDGADQVRGLAIDGQVQHFDDAPTGFRVERDINGFITRLVIEPTTTN